MIIEKSTLAFLKELKKHNNREWFQANRDKYEAAKSNFAGFVESVISKMQAFDTTLDGLDVKQTLFRINRDIRFSKNKSPYKENFAASITAGGKKIARAGYYLHLEPGAHFLGGGWYMPDANNLNAIRQEIDYNLAEFNKLLGQSGFRKTYGELDDFRLKTKPKGYEADHPAIEHLRQKSYIASTSFSNEEVLDSGFEKTVVNAFKTLHPLVTFLNRSVD